jgi:AcrR family transcriptional regulator
MRDTSKRIQKTKDEIANALCSLLATEQYDVITIQEIADSCSVTRRTLYRHFKTKDEILHHCFKGCATQFSDYIAAHAPKDFYELCIVYFTFWNENMNMLTILNKSGIMYRFASEFESLVMMMSAQTGHGAPSDKKSQLQYMEKYRFHFAYRTAGFWHVTEVWSRENPRKSPEEIAKILTEITSSPSEFQIL